jgi:adenylate cyclase
VAAWLEGLGQRARRGVLALSADRHPEPAVTTSHNAVFLSYASEDAESAARIVAALRAAGIEVWFDQSELRGGDAWDRHIHDQIHDCRLFIAVISTHSNARDEGYFRREWRLAVDRTLDMDENKAFLVPVVIDSTNERGAAVPAAFHHVQWTRLPDGNTPASFVTHVLKLLGADPVTSGASTAAHEARAVPSQRPPSPPARHRHGRWAVSAIVGALALAATGWLAWRNHWLPGTPAGNEAGEKSIAVLPFADMSEQHDQQYFGDGLAEEILNVLGTIPGLKVVGRSSSFRFRDNTQDLRKVGVALGATYIVEGSVRKSGNQLKVTAQLVDASDGTTRWSDTYEPSPADALSLQRTIATAVARALRMTVMDYFSGGGTRSEEAHDLYLRGIRDTDGGDPDAVRRSAIELARAVELDPGYVDGWIGLANAYDNIATSGLGPMAENYRLARQALDKALALDPNNADALATRAFVRMNGYDWSGADQDIRRSLELRKSVSGIEAQAKLATARGKLSEAVGLLEGVLATDPLDVYALTVLSFPLYPALGRFRDADQMMNKARDINSRTQFLNSGQALVALWLGDRERALRLADAEPDEVARLQALIPIYAATGRKDLATKTLEQLAHNPAASHYVIAEVYASQSELDLAFQLLEKSYSERSPELLLLQVDPLIANLRPDPRYKALLRKLKLPE